MAATEAFDLLAAVTQGFDLPDARIIIGSPLEHLACNCFRNEAGLSKFHRKKVTTAGRRPHRTRAAFVNAGIVAR